MTERKLFKCADDDPDRCQGGGTGGKGQCSYLSFKGMARDGHIVEGSNEEDFAHTDKCPRCLAGSARQSIRKEKVHDYRLGLWQQRLDEFAESEKVKTLRGEVGILRIVMEEIGKKCKTADDVLMYSAKLTSVAKQIESLVVQCSRLEDRLGLVMDKETVLAFGTAVVANVHKLLENYYEDADQNASFLEDLKHALTEELENL